MITVRFGIGQSVAAPTAAGDCPGGRGRRTERPIRSRLFVIVSTYGFSDVTGPCVSFADDAAQGHE
jgi:hypothetical protein